MNLSVAGSVTTSALRRAIGAAGSTDPATLISPQAPPDDPRAAEVRPNQLVHSGLGRQGVSPDAAAEVRFSLIMLAHAAPSTPKVSLRVGRWLCRQKVLHYACTAQIFICDWANVHGR